MKALLISTYEMGRQPFGVASASAWLKRAGWEVLCADVARHRLDETVAATAELIGFHLPMHTATRLAAPLIRRLRARNRQGRICAFGLYAPLNAAWLRSIGVDHVLGAEFEQELISIASGAVRDGSASTSERGGGRSTPIPRLRFVTPDRSGLPSLSRYASLQMPDGSRRLVGYTESTRGCKHLCRHCPIVPIYNGQFRVVQPDVIAADIESQVAAGAQHITFGDPDFLNAPTHALRVVEALHAAHPGVSHDVTIKIEHLLQHRHLIPRLVAAGCAFVTSAVESIDDRVLQILAKGHTREDFVEAAELCRRSGLVLVPTFVTFHPWLTLDGYCELLDLIAALDLVDRVAPIQLAIRLLLPQGSHLLGIEEMRGHLRAYDPDTLTYRWAHPDPRVDALHREVSAIVGARISANRRAVFTEVSALAHGRAGHPAPDSHPARDRATVPYLNEPWYC